MTQYIESIIFNPNLEIAGLGSSPGLNNIYNLQLLLIEYKGARRFLTTVTGIAQNFDNGVLLGAGNQPLAFTVLAWGP